jgi:DNA polymerase III gamma/tau subunit
VFILATTEPQKIPATILSRCMRFDFKLIPQADLEGLIKDVFNKTGKEYEDEAVSAIARAGAGSARDSLSIADMCASYSQGKLTYEDVNSVLGSADFSSISEIVEGMLCQDAQRSLESVESVLSTGKGVGVLTKDLLAFINNCAIVKMCRNAKEILNLPADRYNRIKEVADVADGHKILRTTEILAKAESDMRYSLNGRITLETAILKCAMPDSDYNIDALIGRVATLERKLEEGVKVQISSAQVPQKEKSTYQKPEVQPKVLVDVPKKEVKKVEVIPDQSTFDNPFAKVEASASTTTNKQPDNNVQPAFWETQQETVPPTGANGALSEEDKKTLFGKFLRAFRTTRKNAVLFTLCMDLESFFEGDKFILVTPTEAVYKALTREENSKFIADTLLTLGVLSHEVRLKGKGEDKFESAVNKLKDNFKGTDIEIK